MARYVDTMETFRRVFGTLADAGQERFFLAMPLPLMEEIRRMDLDLWIRFCRFHGVKLAHRDYFAGNGQGEIEFRLLEFFAGTRILHSLRAGTADGLSGEDRQILAKAQAIAAGVKGTEPERELQIHDWFCDHVRYDHSEEPAEESRTAAGALLRGKAVCMGIADAFCLLCGLCGLEARRVSGIGVPGREKDLSQPWPMDDPEYRHMWNAVRVNGRWTMVDVTWDVKETRARSRLYFNIGTIRLQKDHRWLQNWLPIRPERKDSSLLRPAGEEIIPAVNPEGLAQGLARMAARKRKGFLTVFGYPCGEEEFAAALLRAGAVSSAFCTGPAAVEASRVVWAEQHRFCSSAREARLWINSLAEQNPPPASLALSFPRSLSDELMARDDRGFGRIVYSSNLRAHTPWGTRGKGDLLVIDEPAWLPPLPRVSTEEELVRFVRKAAAARPSMLEFHISGLLNKETVEEPLFRALYGCGMEDARDWACFCDVRVRVRDLVFRRNAFVADTREEALAALREAARRKLSGARLYCGEALFRRLTADGARDGFALADEAGFPGPARSRDRRFTLLFGEDDA